MIYLDNAATSYPKPKSTLQALKKCMRSVIGNPARSSHPAAVYAAEEIYSVREKVADLFSLSEPEKVVFTINATHSLNLAIKAYVTDKCHVIISDCEHNSVIRPINKLKETLGIEYSEYDFSKDPDITVPPLIRNNTVGIVSTIASNVTGIKGNLAKLSSIAKRYNLFLIIDASQAAGHTAIDLSATPCDVLCAPAHKSLFGIQGSGIAIFKSKTRAETIIEGGSGSNSIDSSMPILLPEGYEAGTPPTPAICALGGGIDFIQSVGICNIEEKLTGLISAARDMLSTVDGITLYGGDLGILSFTLRGLSSDKVSSYLDSKGICTRSGLHCAPTTHRKLGTLETGTVRISFSYFTTVKDIYKLYRTVKDIREG